MRLIKVGVAVLNQTPFDWDNNRRNILSAIQQARNENISVLCLPELCITGYGCEDAFLSLGLQGTALEVLQSIVPYCKGLVVGLGLPVFHGGALFNSVALVVDGRLAGFVCKQFLARDGIHYEPRWFQPWPAGRRAEIKAGGQCYPLGDLLFEIGDLRLGFEICEDAWAAERPGRRLALQEVDLILNPSASHFAFGKFETRKRFVLEGSRAFGVAYLYANLLGNEAGRVIYDGGAMIAAGDKLLAVGPRFLFSDCRLSAALLDLDTLRLNRARRAETRNGVKDAAYQVLKVEFKIPAARPEVIQVFPESWENSPQLKEEEFARAVSLGLFDYLRKSRSHGFVVSLSGGADSSAVACLVWIMLELAAKELTVAGVAKRLSHIAELQPKLTLAQMMPCLLTCIYQATQNSTPLTREAARAVSQALGARFLEFEVQAMVNGYLDLVENSLGCKLNWGRDDIALQNIQARARGPAAWLVANVKQALLLATSNRSEAAVGYTTMDGDTCGGLSPIAGIDKAFLRKWLIWLEKKGVEGLRPLSELHLVNSQEPTAELRPPEQKQTDEKDLMPYEVLDAIERFAIRDKKTPKEVLALAAAQFGDYSAQELFTYVERFFRLWCINQWKRERYAPCFHLDDENLDPKTWCRFPILSGGYEGELRELKQSLQLKQG